MAEFQGRRAKGRTPHIQHRDPNARTEFVIGVCFSFLAQQQRIEICALSPHFGTEYLWKHCCSAEKLQSAFARFEASSEFRASKFHAKVLHVWKRKAARRQKFKATKHSFQFRHIDSCSTPNFGNFSAVLVSIDHQREGMSAIASAKVDVGTV